MIYIYAVADRPDIALPCRRGLHDEVLGTVVHRDIAAIVGDCDGANLSNTADEIWRHEEVVEALMEERSVVPARFGTLVPSREHVGDILRRSYDALADDLARVRGRVEIGVRFLSTHEDDDAGDRSSDEPVPLGTGPGADFLRARLARARRLETAARANSGQSGMPMNSSRGTPMPAGSTANRAVAAASGRRSWCRASASRLFKASWLASRTPMPALRCSAPDRGRLIPLSARLRTTLTRIAMVLDAEPGRKILYASDDEAVLDRFADALPHGRCELPERISIDPRSVERDLARLVLSVIDLVRQLLERQAVRRVESGALSDEEIERLGVTLLKLEARMGELKAAFGLQDHELNLHLGALRDLASE